MIKFIKQHLNSLLWALIILILCGSPSSGFPSSGFFNIPHFDKIVHFGLYVVFTLLLISENNPLRNNGGISKQSIFIALTIAILYGLLIELLQWSVFTSRGAEFWDFLANTFGAIIAVLVYKIVNRFSKGLI